MDDNEKKRVAEPKRPYERPRIAESGRFENLLLACAQLISGPPDCDPNPNLS
jgi:hypothetical protein